MGCSILVVEDEPLIALELREVLEAEGASVLAATQLPHALTLARHPDIYVALLDYRIGENTSAPICQRLEERGVPFLFYTGYDVRSDWPATTVVNKPAPGHLIVDAVRNLLSRCSRRDVPAATANIANASVAAQQGAAEAAAERSQPTSASTS